MTRLRERNILLVYDLTLCFFFLMNRIKTIDTYTFSIYDKYMSHFSYACKMWCLLNLVLESWEYL